MSRHAVTRELGPSASSVQSAYVKGHLGLTGEADNGSSISNSNYHPNTETLRLKEMSGSLLAHPSAQRKGSYESRLGCSSLNQAGLGNPRAVVLLPCTTVKSPPPAFWKSCWCWKLLGIPETCYSPNAQFPQPLDRTCAPATDHLGGPLLSSVQFMDVYPVLWAQDWVQYSRSHLAGSNHCSWSVAKLLLIHPRMLLVFFVTKAHSWLAFSTWTTTSIPELLKTAMPSSFWGPFPPSNGYHLKPAHLLRSLGQVVPRVPTAWEF